MKGSADSGLEYFNALLCLTLVSNIFLDIFWIFLDLILVSKIFFGVEIYLSFLIYI